MVAWWFDLCKIILSLFRIEYRTLRKSRETNNGIHWSSDIMAHIWKEQSLCAVCVFSHWQGILQHLSLLHFMLYVIINIHESQKEIRIILRFTHSDNLELHVGKLVIYVGTVIDIETFFWRKLVKNILAGKCHSHHVTVTFINRNTDIKIHGILIALVSKILGIERANLVIYTNNPDMTWKEIDHINVGIVIWKGINNIKLIEHFLFAGIILRNVLYNWKTDYIAGFFILSENNSIPWPESIPRKIYPLEIEPQFIAAGNVAVSKIKYVHIRAESLFFFSTHVPAQVINKLSVLAVFWEAKGINQFNNRIIHPLNWFTYDLILCNVKLKENICICYNGSFVWVHINRSISFRKIIYMNGADIIYWSRENGNCSFIGHGWLNQRVTVVLIELFCAVCKLRFLSLIIHLKMSYICAGKENVNIISIDIFRNFLAIIRPVFLQWTFSQNTIFKRKLNNGIIIIRVDLENLGTGK